MGTKEIRGIRVAIMLFFRSRVAMAFFLFFGLIIFGVSAGVLPGSGWEEMMRLVPNRSYMATSPVAIEKLKSDDQGRQKEAQANAERLETLKAASRVPINSESSGGKADAIIIPSIEAFAPIVTAQSADANALHGLLDSGAVLYPGSALFGNPGQTILIGHSAPSGWPDIKRDTLFSRLIELVPGDTVVAIYNDKTYRYSVVRSQIIKKGGEIEGAAIGGSTLVLVTCWPPGRDLKRLAVEAKLESIDE